MNTFWKRFIIIGLPMLVLMTIKYSNKIESYTHSQLPIVAEKNITSWQSANLKQDDGRMLSLELLFKLDKHMDLSSKGDPNLKKAESYTHEGMEGGIFVVAYHGVVSDPNIKVNFNKRTFMSSFNNSEKQKTEVQSLEPRIINGQNVTYAKIKYAVDDEEWEMQGLGINENNEFWKIMCCYRADNDKAAQNAKHTIESLKIQ